MLPELLSLALSLTAQTPQAAQAAHAADPDKEMVCKYHGTTGTRFRKKECRTRAQWEAMSENAKRDASETFNKPTINTDRGN